MVSLVGRWWRMGRLAILAAGTVSGLIMLPGCASSGVGTAADSGATTFTPSDEPEARRRARIRLELASNYFELGQTSVALDEVKQALAADPNYADAYNMRGLIFLQLNDYPQADESFRRALALKPGDSNMLHNQGWLFCQQKKYAEAQQNFARALANPTYTARSKTWMANGLCQLAATQLADAEASFQKAYELDAGNPIVGYHLASLLFRRNEAKRAQFYIRRLNNSELANAETLWLGVKVERMLGDSVAMRQLGDQLRKRFPDSKELAAYERGAFNE